MAPPESGPSFDEEPEHESPRAKKWAYLAALQSLGGIERQQQKVREDLRQGRIRPSEALRREEELRQIASCTSIVPTLWRSIW